MGMVEEGKEEEDEDEDKDGDLGRVLHGRTML